MGYTIEQYLLDKSNIHDTVTQLVRTLSFRLHLTSLTGIRIESADQFTCADACL